MANKNLNAAKNAKKDEFYTQLVDIENELRHYKQHFKDKTVLCNCDDPRVSNFFHYFSYNFEQLGLKKLITTCYKNQNRDLFSQNDSERAIWLEYFGDKNNNRVPDPEEIGIHYFQGDGDFRSQECIELLKEADIVVTNPPFSLFREYVAQLMKYEKKFVIVGHQNAIHYKEIFPLIKENKLWLGYGFKGGAAHFYSKYEDIATAGDHREGMIRVSGVNWFTNMEIPKRHEDMILYKTYNSEEYPKYDNFDAINVNKTSEIPVDYEGLLGVPITFLDKYNPEQFEILGTSTMDMSKGAPYVKGKRIYERILIRRRQSSASISEFSGPVETPADHADKRRTYQQPDIPLPLAAEDEIPYDNPKDVPHTPSK
ncbi:MAG: adenine-specific methyltransferase EcoRI family protein [Bacteroidales bacterium]|nr:adenine-specific methyltransferase EcoRI family protein [Bacteroidales bacterium]